MEDTINPEGNSDNRTVRSIIFDTLMGQEKNEHYGNYITEIITKLDSGVQTSSVYMLVLNEYLQLFKKTDNPSYSFIISQLEYLLKILKEKILY